MSTTIKKVMKKVEVKKAPDLTPIRKLFNTILGKAKGTLTLTENKHGAVQIKREGNLLFSAKPASGIMLITHPMYAGKNKKERTFKHAGTGWDHLSQVPLDKVTIQMLETRISDKKTGLDYHKEFYKGKMDQSGLARKIENAREKAKIVSKNTSARKAVKVVAKEALKRVASKSAKAIRKVAVKANA